MSMERPLERDARSTSCLCFASHGIAGIFQVVEWKLYYYSRMIPGFRDFPSKMALKGINIEFVIPISQRAGCTFAKTILSHDSAEQTGHQFWMPV